MSKYYILEDSFVLRGWQHTGQVLIRRPNNAHRFLKETDFRTLLLCDGQTDFESSYITDEMRDLAVRMEKKNIIRSCEKGAKLAEDQQKLLTEDLKVLIQSGALSGTGAEFRLPWSVAAERLRR